MTESLAYHDRRLAEARLGVADGAAHMERRVVRPPLVDSHRGAERLLGVDEGDERLVLDGDHLEGVGQEVRALGHHHGQRLAHVAHHVPGEHGHGEGPILMDARAPRHHRPADLGQVGGCPHRDDAGALERLTGLDLQDARMGVGTPEHAQVQHARPREIVEEATGAHEKPVVVLAPGRGADEVGAGGHPGSVCARPLTSSRAPGQCLRGHAPRRGRPHRLLRDDRGGLRR